METKDRTQASYILVDINEQTRIDFEKCKETREQKIKRLKKEIETVKMRITMLTQYGTETQLSLQLTRLDLLEQQLKELEDGNKGTED